MTLNLGEKTTTQFLYKAAIQDVEVKITTEFKNKVIASREVLEMINSKEEPVYGVSTGFGLLENTWIPKENQELLQQNLIRSHAVGTGPQVPDTIAKMAMVLLANSLAKGYSGIRLETLELLVQLIKHNIIPLTYTIGSLGASGDLAPLAHIALALMGEGMVTHGNETHPTMDVFTQIGIQPINLSAKEGLALINGTHFVTAYSIFCLEHAHDLLKHSLLAASLTIEALRGTDTPFDPGISAIRAHPGQIIVARAMKKLLDGSNILSSHRDPRHDRKVQDAYAIRCIPQVMGAIWNALTTLQQVADIEANSVTDNPLIIEDKVISGGNFHAEPLGLPLEYVALALVELGNITEARIARLVSPTTTELPAFLASEAGLESGYMIAHYTTAALLNKVRNMSHPNLADNIPVSGGQEDHVSMAMNTAVKTYEILHLVEEIVSFELLMAVRGLSLTDHPTSSPVLEAVLKLISQNLTLPKTDHVIRDVQQGMLQLMRGGELIQLVDSIVPDVLPAKFSSNTNS